MQFLADSFDVKDLAFCVYWHSHPLYHARGSMFTTQQKGYMCFRRASGCAMHLPSSHTSSIPAGMESIDTHSCHVDVQAEPLSAVPNFGGHDSQGSTGFKILGDGPIPTPRQLVAMLDQYVIGQDKAKRVSSVHFATAFWPHTGLLGTTCMAHISWNPVSSLCSVSADCVYLL